MSYQKLIVVGNLGRDPEMRYLPNGNAVTNFNVATNRTYTDSNDQKVKETTWFRVSAWGRQAETCNEFLKSGSKVLIEGRLTPDKDSGNPRVYQRSDGEMGASYELTADRVVFMSGKDEAPQGQQEFASDDDTPF